MGKGKKRERGFLAARKQDRTSVSVNGRQTSENATLECQAEEVSAGTMHGGNQSVRADDLQISTSQCGREGVRRNQRSAGQMTVAQPD